MGNLARVFPKAGKFLMTHPTNVIFLPIDHYSCQTSPPRSGSMYLGSGGSVRGSVPIINCVLEVLLKYHEPVGFALVINLLFLFISLLNLSMRYSSRGVRSEQRAI